MAHLKIIKIPRLCKCSNLHLAAGVHDSGNEKSPIEPLLHMFRVQG